VEEFVIVGIRLVTAETLLSRVGDLRAVRDERKLQGSYGGLFVYSVCSVYSPEGTFVGEETAVAVDIEAVPGRSEAGGGCKPCCSPCCRRTVVESGLRMLAELDVAAVEVAWLGQ
jgi:hypothetical protein